MDFSIETCWDCPVHLSAVLIEFAILIAVAAGGAAMLRTRWRLAQFFGFLVAALAVLLAAMITGVAPHWGIWRPGDALRTFSRGETWTIYGSLDVLLAAAMIVPRRIARARLRTTPTSPSD